MSTPSATVVGDYDPNQPRTRTFFDARQSFLDGTSTPRDYLEECLSTIDKLEPVVQAWVCLNTENARLAADESTQRYSQGNSLSPIDGMPIGIKDVLQTHDMPTTLGSPIFAGRNTGIFRFGQCLKARRRSDYRQDGNHRIRPHGAGSNH